MNRIDRSFDTKDKKLIAYMVCGYPDHESCVGIIESVIANGADIIEIGIPFSDPIADGRLIQMASERSIKNGFCLKNAFDTVKIIRKRYDIPILFMLYFNTIYRYGINRFLNECKKSDIDGLIIPDLPFEEHDEVKKKAKTLDINIISMISPTSENRIEMIAKDADNFIYCVSSMGVTGKRNNFDEKIFDLSEKIKKYTNKKTAVGFGISNTKQANLFSKHFDGIIIGSAIIDIIDENTIKNSPAKAGEFISRIKKAINIT